MFKEVAMKIGELAKTAQTQTETIRYYEREGLLPEAARTDANYRIYDESHVQRLAFIRHCRSLDMTLAEIRTLLDFKDAPAGSCADVNTCWTNTSTTSPRAYVNSRRWKKTSSCCASSAPAARPPMTAAS
jgi:DNA-binding transcriptional MerR regulator